jgi:AHBA synthesis associated protein
MGRPLEEIVDRLSLPAEFAGTYRRIASSSLDLVALYEGVVELLATAVCLGCRLGVMTGKDRRRTVDVLDRFRLLTYFRGMVCGDDPHPAKPHPGGLRLLLVTLAGDLGISSAAMVGDSHVDVACARAAGVMAIGAGWGFSPPEALEAAGAFRTFSNPQSLCHWLVSGQIPSHVTTLSEPQVGESL